MITILFTKFPNFRRCHYTSPAQQEARLRAMNEVGNQANLSIALEIEKKQPTNDKFAKELAKDEKQMIAALREVLRG